MPLKVNRLCYVLIVDGQHKPLKVVTTLMPMVEWMHKKNICKRSYRNLFDKMKKFGYYSETHQETTYHLYEMALNKGLYIKPPKKV